MKVLFFSHQSGFIYGGEVSTLAFMRELRALGVEVHLACPPGVFADRAAEFARVHPVPALQFSRKVAHLPFLLPALMRTSQALARIVAAEKVDIVHAMSLKAMAYCVPLLGAPIFWHHHDILPEGKKNHAWLRFFALRAKKILVPSRASREALLEAGVPAEKVEILYNGLVASDWHARPARTEGPLRVGFVGEISPRKGVDLLPELLPLVARDTTFVLIGDGLSDPEFARALREKLETYGERVKFLGRREDVKELLQGIDVLWIPSRQEPFGIVLLEAAFSGLPVVAAPVGGIPEIVETGVTGYLAPGVTEMAECLRELRDVSLWSRISRATTASAHKRFEMKALGGRLLALYTGALGNAR